MTRKVMWLSFYLLLAAFANLQASTAIIAHRGASGLAPENTMVAFQKAIEIGAEYFELDVRMSKDDSLLLMHDETIDRTTNKTGAISALTYRELRGADAGSWFSTQYTNVQIPKLSEALDLALASPYPVGVVIEIKATNATIVDRVVAEVQKRNMANRVIISSFNFSQIQKSKQLDATIPVQLFGAITQANINQVAGIGGEWVGTSGAVTRALLDSAAVKNIRVNKWTVNNPSEMVALMNIGAHAITTNYPDIGKAVTDTTPPSDVVLLPPAVRVTKVQLQWLPAEDPESGVMGYQIYRDQSEGATTLLATVGDTTSYIDETMVESTTFYYRVKAVNLPGIASANYSNEVMVTTLTDQQPPKVSSIVAFGRADRLVVGYNELVDPAGAVNLENYQILPGITITQAMLNLDSTSVTLHVSPMAENTPYTLIVKGVQDQASIPNLLVEPLEVPFQFKPWLPSTVAVWDMNDIETAQLTDYSGNNNHATLKNGLGFGPGQAGNGLLFDGVDDMAQIPASPSLDINGSAVSISLWAKFDFLPSELPGAYGPTFDSEGDNYVIYEDKANNELRFKVTTDRSAERPGIVAADVKKDVWLHLVGVYDGAAAKIYLNGQLKDSHLLTGNVRPGQVATLGFSQTSYLKGSLDEIHIFNRALTTDEILFLFKGAKTPIVDAEPPAITSVVAIGAPERLYVNFSEPVEKGSAETITNYTISDGIAITAAHLAIDGRSVMLSTSPLSRAIAYTLAVSGVEDLAEEANQILPNTSVQFQFRQYPEGLAASWMMDEAADTTAFDGSGNNNSMFLRGGVEWSPGALGNGLSFDAVDDYAIVPLSPSLDSLGAGVTVSLWVKLNYMPADMPFNVGPIYDCPTDNYVIYEDKGNRELRFKVTTDKGAERPGIPAADLKVDEWLHVVGVYDGSSARIYMNGELKDVHPRLTGVVKPGQVAQLGKDGSWLFSGGIDQVQVYNRGLTPQEVIWLYAGADVPVLNIEAVDQTSVTLSWNGVSDPLYGLSGYKVYRDTTDAPTELIATLGDTTHFVDDTKSEAATYYYRVRSVDASGVESAWYSNTVSATTGADTTPPQLLRVSSTGEAGKVLAQFSEKVAAVSATLAANYTLDGGATVDSVHLALDGRTAMLHTSGLAFNNSYTLTVNQVSDLAEVPNLIPDGSSLSFIYHAPLAGLIAYWPLDETQDSTATDVSGMGNHGQLGNAPAHEGGLFGNALRFNGATSYVAIPASPSLNIDTSAVSVSLWINPDYLPTTMPYGIGPIYDAPTDNYVVYQDKGNKELRFKVTTTKGAERPGIPEAMLTTGKWQHIVGVYDGTQAKIYLNGQLVDSHPNLTGAVKPNQVARLGNDGANWYSGLIDNVQVYRTALSDDEIFYLYTGIRRTTGMEQRVMQPEFSSLAQNYPNPFNPATMLTYNIASKGLVKLTVYDLLGRKVATLVNQVQDAGHYQISWNARDESGAPVSSGVYLYKLTTEGFTATRKMLLVR